MSGWKTNLFAILTMVLPALSETVSTFVSANPGWVGGLVGGLFFFLRQLTSKPSGLLPK